MNIPSVHNYPPAKIPQHPASSKNVHPHSIPEPLRQGLSNQVLSSSIASHSIEAINLTSLPGEITVPVVQVLTPTQKSEHLQEEIHKASQLLSRIIPDFKKISCNTTMIFLGALNLNSAVDGNTPGGCSSECERLMLNNTQSVLRNGNTFILNNGAAPFQMELFPARGEDAYETPQYITPVVTLKSLKGGNNTESLNREATAEENRVIRDHIYKTLETFYGTAILQSSEQMQALINPENHTHPLTYGEVNVIANDLNKKLNDETEGNHDTDLPYANFKVDIRALENRYAQFTPTDREQLLDSYGSAESDLNQLTEDFRNASEVLDHPNTVRARALWYLAETIARGGAAFAVAFSVMLGLRLTSEFLTAYIGKTKAFIIVAFPYLLAHSPVVNATNRYFATGVAAQKMVEAFRHLDEDKATLLLKTMRHDQQPDQQALENMNGFFERLSTTFADNSEFTPEALSLIKAMLSQKITERIAGRTELIKALQEKIENANWPT